MFLFKRHIAKSRPIKWTGEFFACSEDVIQTKEDTDC
jgi:hypothetical protein